VTAMLIVAAIVILISIHSAVKENAATQKWLASEYERVNALKGQDDYSGFYNYR